MTVTADLGGSPAIQVTIGVDTHQEEHVAVAIDRQGVRLVSAAHPRIRPAIGSWNVGPKTREILTHSESRARVRTVPGSPAS